MPLWLSPEQIRIIPISERLRDEAMAVTDKLSAAGFRVSCDDRNEKMGYRIREAQLEKIPYMLIIGDKEVENGTVSVRQRGGVDLGSMTVEEFIAMAEDEVKTKKIK
jgi:threonyl-tRNA synthetase